MPADPAAALAPARVPTDNETVAHRKGKSRRRIKDWHRRMEHGQDLEEVSSRGRRMSEHAVKLREERFASVENLDDLPQAEGMVVGLYRGGAVVRVEGGEELLCGVAKTFRAPSEATPLAVGDHATVALPPEGAPAPAEDDKDRVDGMILARAERTTALARPRPWSAKRRDEYAEEPGAKVIAANMDVLLIIAATKGPRFRRPLVDRFLITAERGGLTPVLVLNKIDLKRPKDELLEDFAALEVEVHCTSATTGEGLHELVEALGGRKNVMAGASGVGKTALVNAILPDVQARTGKIREKDQRGRHTTSSAAVYELPAGGLLVDTPGVRELGVDLEATELPWFFPEFEPFAPQCRFSDCTHTHEPDCAVQAAVESGEIPHRRFESYLRIQDSLAE